ncbi:MAG: hypothetical protein QM813_08180 [Verrucomicrobiota bacterium]
MLPPSIDERQFADDAFQGGIALLFFQHAQTAQQRQTGVHQRRQLAGERGEDLGFNIAAKTGDLNVDADAAFFLAGQLWPMAPLASLFSPPFL